MLEDRLVEIASKGLFLNNLCQLPSGIWRANVTDYQNFWEYAEAATPEEALAVCLKIVLDPMSKPCSRVEDRKWQDSKVVLPGRRNLPKPGRISLDEL